MEISGGLGNLYFVDICAGANIIIGEGTAIKSGEGIKAGHGIEAGEGIKAGRGIEAGRGIKAGWGIEAGLSIKGTWIDCKLRIFAGMVSDRLPTEEETAISGIIRSGTVAFGKVVATNT